MASALVPEKASPKVSLYKAYAAYKESILKRAANRERVYLLPFEIWSDPLSDFRRADWEPLIASNGC